MKLEDFQSKFRRFVRLWKSRVIIKQYIHFDCFKIRCERLKRHNTWHCKSIVKLGLRVSSFRFQAELVLNVSWIQSILYKIKFDQLSQKLLGLFYRLKLFRGEFFHFLSVFDKVNACKIILWHGYMVGLIWHKKRKLKVNRYFHVVWDLCVHFNFHHYQSEIFSHRRSFKPDLSIKISSFNLFQNLMLLMFFVSFRVDMEYRCQVGKNRIVIS